MSSQKHCCRLPMVCSSPDHQIQNLFTIPVYPKIKLKHWILCTLVSLFTLCCVNTVHNFPTVVDNNNSVPHFRYRTNFFDILRLKSRLVRSSTRNVTALLSEFTVNDNYNYNDSDNHTIVTNTTTTSTNAPASVKETTVVVDNIELSTISSLAKIIEEETATVAIPAINDAESTDGLEVEETASALDSNFALSDLFPSRQCGIAHRNAHHDDGRTTTTTRQGRIVGGEMVRHGEFPWMASLLLRGRHYCGAVILDHQWLLTAAHCVHGHDASSFTALLGSVYSLSTSTSGRGIHAHLGGSSSMTSLTQPSETNQTESLSSDINVSNQQQQQQVTVETFSSHPSVDDDKMMRDGKRTISNGYENLLLAKVDKLIVHENFTRTEFFRNDIALMRLSEKVPYSDFISPVCLPLETNTRLALEEDANNSLQQVNEVPDRIENDILPVRSEHANKRRAMFTHSRLDMSNQPPQSHGIVVGWGAVEKYGDSTASRGFLKELNKKKLAVFHSEMHNHTQMLKSTDMEDVLRLRKVELPFIDRFTCERWYTSRGRPIRLIEAQFCAGLFEGGKDACRGDSGGPILERFFTYDQEGQVIMSQYQVVGIVSAGIGCALPKLPGIYTRVESYNEWIREKMTDTVLTERAYSSYEFEDGWQRKR